MKKNIKDNSILLEYKDFIIKLLIIILTIGILYFLFNIFKILVIIFFALFLNILFSPFLNKLNKYKIPDWLGITLIYSILIIFIVIVFFAIIPIFIKQTVLIVSNISIWLNWLKDSYIQYWISWLGLPVFIENNLQWILSKIDFNSLIDSLSNNFSTISSFLTNNFKKFLTSWAWIFFSITNTIWTFFIVFVFAFFIALERKQIRKFFYQILPIKISKYIVSKEEKIIDSLYLWLKWQALLWLSIFVLVFFGLIFIRLFWVYIEEYFLLALIAWLMEFVPYLWPIIALLPVIAISAFFWLKAVIIVVILYIIIQQIENNFLVPYIMSKTLSISPFATITAFIIWANLFWIIWIILAVPILAIIKIFLEDKIN